MRPLSLLLAFLLFVAVGSAQNTNQNQQPPLPVVRIGDVLAVAVFGTSTYSGEYPVLEDGSINGPGIGRLIVVGKTLPQVKEMVRVQLAKIIKNPQVDVFFKSQSILPVYVVGSAKGPGPVNWVPNQTLRELVLSVGLPGDADLLEATLYRKNGEIITIDLEKLLRGDTDQANPVVEAFDSLIILPKKYIRVVYNPGPYGGPTARTGEIRVDVGTELYQAISQFGGITAPGPFLLDELQIVVRRGDQVSSFPAKQTPSSPRYRLQAGDFIFVQAPDQVRLTVTGEVVEPAELVVNKDTSITAVIGRAKGLTAVASQRNVVVLRGGTAYHVDATPGAQALQRFQLENNDVIFVRRNEQEVFALGQVNAPGRYLIPEDKEWRATDLLASARGLSDRGTLRRIHLVRPDATGKYVITVFNLDEALKDGKGAANPVLKPGDILLFGQPKGLTIGSLGQIISSALLFENIFSGRNN